MICPDDEDEATLWLQSIRNVFSEYKEAVKKGSPEHGRLANGMTIGEYASYLAFIKGSEKEARKVAKGS